jgi:hypothetical protein
VPAHRRIATVDVSAHRASLVVALQTLLMCGVRDFDADPGVAAHAKRMLATAAALDYVLMLATDAAGTRIPPDDAARAMRAGIARAVDDSIVLLRVILACDGIAARTFVREGVRTLHAAIDAESLASDDRRFAMIALASYADV